MRKERDSNIELLRIVAMLMIVLHHLCLYGYAGFGDGGWGADFERNLMIVGGKIGVDVFVLISGYFLASGRIKILSFLRVLFEAWFYALVIGLLCAAVSPATFELKTFLKSFLPTGGGLPWFVTAYLGMYLVAPWLSRLASVLDKGSFKQMLLVGFLVFSLIPTLTNCTFISSNFAWFCYLFLVACFIRRFDLSRAFSRCLLIGGGSLLVLSVIGLELLSSRLPFIQGHVAYFSNQDSFLTLAISVGLLCLFKDMRVGHIKWVNLIAQGTFGVYLIHENVFMRQLLWPHFDFVFSSGVALVIPLALVSMVGVFAVLTAVDLVRLNLLEKPLFDLLGRKCGKLFDRCDCVLNGRGDRQGLSAR